MKLYTVQETFTNVPITMCSSLSITFTQKGYIFTSKEKMLEHYHNVRHSPCLQGFTMTETVINDKTGEVMYSSLVDPSAYQEKEV